MTRVLVTGAAGFIGFHLCKRLADNPKFTVTGLDNFSPYYDVNLKRDRASILEKIYDVPVMQQDLRDRLLLEENFKDLEFDLVVHLAASVGVRHSYDNAMEYIDNNVIGTQNLIEFCKAKNIRKVVYASTSCVMAGNPLPWAEDVPTGHQLNPYGYTKRTNECQFMTSGINNTIGLRFFTVYGPYGRPDMALFQFADAAVNGKTIDVFNYGKMKRDFTYVDDIVVGIKLVVDRISQLEAPMNEIYNIGRGRQVDLMDFIGEIEKNFGREIKKNLVPRHPADTLETWSDTRKLQSLGWKPTTSIPEGVAKFAEWYKHYYGVN